MKKLFSKEEKAVIRALINLNISKGNLIDKQDINSLGYQIGNLIGKLHSDERESIREIIENELKA